MGEMENIRDAILASSALVGIAIDLDMEEGAHVLRFEYGGHVAVVGCGYTTARNGKQMPWATVYRLEATGGAYNRRAAIHLLFTIKKCYSKLGYDFAYSCAETSFVQSVLYLTKIKVREESRLAVGV